MVMELKELLIKRLMKIGYSEKGGNRVWDIAHRKFLYMTEELSKLFLKMREHERYKKIVVDKELELINSNKKLFLEMLNGKSFNLIDMGCGDGIKAKAFLSNLEGSNANVKFFPVSVSDYLVNVTLENIGKEKFSVVKESAGDIACFESLDEVASTVRSAEYQKNVILLLGSILASFDINDYLFNLSNAMFKDDVLIIGNGVRRGDRLANLENYQHSYFSKWFMPLVRELGFKEDEVEYNARLNHKRVEMFYKIKVDKVFECSGKKIEFKKGDEILVMTLYKFFEQELKDFCKMYFSDVKILKDPEGEYALAVCKK